ncbi:MAG TPA: tripartite tricarboxylate transporter substrate binding protein [Usitatibacter sp.]|nr:tripartite tricarboxylate transporter substrate binding protein [Usitatibacter sp.]
MRFVRAAVAAFAMGFAAHAAAQGWPAKPIKLVVPLAAAGTGDTLARAVGEEMGRILGQPVVIENRPGAGGLLGTEMVANAQPDGYTLLAVSPSHVINATLYSKAGYDPVKSFEPITLMAYTHQILVAHPSVPFGTLKELIDYAKKNPGKLNYGSAGTGSATHLNMELFKSMSGTDIVHVPYKGSTQARQDVVGGQVQLAMDGLLPVLSLIKDGRLKALALTSGHRSPSAPEIPTMAEAGVPGYVSDTWYGLLAPAGTPRDVLAKLEEAAIKAINTPAVRDRLTKAGAEPAGSTAAEFRKTIEREKPIWAKVVKDSGAKVD